MLSALQNTISSRYSCISGGIVSRFAAYAHARWVSRFADPVFPHLFVPNEDDVSALQRIVGKQHVFTATARSNDEHASVLTDWMKQYHSRADRNIIVYPGSTAEVAEIMHLASVRRFGLTVQGGNTGLVGGAVPISHEIALCMRRMNKIHSIDESSGVLVADAGAILQACDEACAAVGLMMPLDLGAKGSCHIGGNVSTHAGGLRYLRYGSLRNTVLGLQAVTAQGQVMDCMSQLRKDNVGFDVKQMFIGSEGCLGIVTKVAIQAVAKPLSVNVALIGLESFDQCVSTLRRARQELGEILSAVEFVDAATLDITVEHLLGGQGYPLSGRPKFYLTIETHGSNAAHDMEKLQLFLEKLMAAGAVDGIVAADTRQARSLWRLREDAAMYDVVDAMRDRLEGELQWRSRQDVRVVGYGHLGDGNIHLNISTPSRNDAYHEELYKDIEPFVFDWTLQRGGSVSAEHGLGQAKAKLLARAKPAEVVHLMRALKTQLDPNGVLNPGKVLV